MAPPQPLRALLTLLKKSGRAFKAFVRAIVQQLRRLGGSSSSHTSSSAGDGLTSEGVGEGEGAADGSSCGAQRDRGNGSLDCSSGDGDGTKPKPAENGTSEYFDAAKLQKQNKELAGAVKNVYLLERGYTEVARLNYQHFLFKEAMGFLIHPSLLEGKNVQDLRIVDIGTGTAQWPIDLSRSLPHTTIEGYDISPAQYPPLEWMPENVKLGVLDIMAEDLPEDMIGKYDVVHVRLLMSVVRGNDPSKVLTNLTKLLKPGGWLQWSEYTPETFNIHTVDPNTSLPKIRALHEMFVTRMAEINSYYDWIPQLASTFSAPPHRLQNTRKIIHTLRPADYFTYGVSNLQVYRMLLPLGVADEGKVAEILRSVGEAWEECKQEKGMLKWEPVTYLGQKSVGR